MWPSAAVRSPCKAHAHGGEAPAGRARYAPRSTQRTDHAGNAAAPPGHIPAAPNDAPAGALGRSFKGAAETPRQLAHPHCGTWVNPPWVNGPLRSRPPRLSKQAAGGLETRACRGATGAHKKPNRAEDDMPAANAFATNGTAPADRAMNRVTACYA